MIPVESIRRMSAYVQSHSEKYTLPAGSTTRPMGPTSCASRAGIGGGGTNAAALGDALGLGGALVAVGDTATIVASGVADGWLDGDWLADPAEAHAANRIAAAVQITASSGAWQGMGSRSGEEQRARPFTNPTLRS